MDCGLLCIIFEYIKVNMYVFYTCRRYSSPARTLDICTIINVVSAKDKWFHRYSSLGIPKKCEKNNLQMSLLTLEIHFDSESAKSISRYTFTLQVQKLNYIILRLSTKPV